MSRPGRSLEALLEDLVAWGETVERSAGRTGRELVADDEQSELALSRAVEIAGEIAGRLPAGRPDRWPAVGRKEPRSACRVRNRMAHGYDSISAGVLFDAAARDVRRLAEPARGWLAAHDEP